MTLSLLFALSLFGATMPVVAAESVTLDPLVRAETDWSITMYDGITRLLVDNAIDRYLLNSPMLDSLVKNDDGPVTVHIQAAPPGKALRANWPVK